MIYSILALGGLAMHDNSDQISQNVMLDFRTFIELLILIRERLLETDGVNPFLLYPTQDLHPISIHPWCFLAGKQQGRKGVNHLLLPHPSLVSLIKLTVPHSCFEVKKKTSGEPVMDLPCRHVNTWT